MGDIAELYDGEWDNKWYEDEETVQCKYCKRRGFYWIQLDNGAWRLETQRGKAHKCKAYTEAKKKA